MEIILVQYGVENDNQRFVPKEAVMITEFPRRITIDGFVYEKQSAHDDAMYYNSKDNPSEITSRYVSLYPNGELTYFWNGIEMKWNKQYKVIKEIAN